MGAANIVGRAEPKKETEGKEMDACLVRPILVPTSPFRVGHNTNNKTETYLSRFFSFLRLPVGWLPRIRPTGKVFFLTHRSRKKAYCHGLRRPLIINMGFHRLPTCQHARRLQPKRPTCHSFGLPLRANNGTAWAAAQITISRREAATRSSVYGGVSMAGLPH